jgi:hypothetical protein
MSTVLLVALNRKCEKYIPSAAQADSEEKPVIAAVNRCAAQKACANDS